MRKKEAGQAFILVLILLAIGALLAVPALRLSFTEIKSSQIVVQKTRSLYAASAAQEFILWKLLHDGLGAELMQSPDPNPSAHYDFDVCGVPVGVTVYMRATEGTGGITLATDDKIKPTKEVTPSYVEGKREELYTYTIILDHLSDNTSVKLDAIYDIPSGGFGSGAYDKEYGSWLSLDGGETWLPIPDPDSSKLVSKGYLKWPADYEWKDGVTGAFSSHPEFLGIEDFEVREVKKLRFKMRGTLGDNQVHCNWVVLKMEDDTNTLSGPQAPIKVGGDPDIPGVCEDSSVVAVTKKSDPEIIPPGVETDITYTCNITNMYTQTRHIQEITDYLPPGFYYSSNSTSGSGTLEGILDPIVADNGVARQQLRWTEVEFGGGDVKIDSGETLTLTFSVQTTKDVSGSYYNEVIVILSTTGISISAFGEAGVSPWEYGSNYSWNTGTVMVPAFDSSANATGVTINANMSLILEGITITSWHIR